MRHPSEKHNVARLRVELNKFEKFEKFDQKRFADLIGCSVCKLQNIETGRTPLDELLARRISDETGIACEWLLKNDTKAPPAAAFVKVLRNKRGRYTLKAFKQAVLMRERGAPFTAETYKQTRLERDLGIPVQRKTLARDLVVLTQSCSTLGCAVSSQPKTQMSLNGKPGSFSKRWRANMDTAATFCQWRNLKSRGFAITNCNQSK